MLFYENLEEIIFNRHELFDVDELVVLSGYIGPQPVSRLVNLPFTTSVIYGMYGSDSIGENLHNSLIKINTEHKNTTIMYSELPVHSKCYVWRKQKSVVTALVGSANFSVNGLRTPYREVLAETTRDTFSPLNTYLDFVLKSSVLCDSDTIKLKKSKKSNLILPNEVDEAEEGIYKASLLDRKGIVPKSSGLNWGLSSGHTADGDAYIKISKSDIVKKSSIFPPKQLIGTRTKEGGKPNRVNDAVEFIWDDGEIMEGLLEGTQEVDGVPYPKQICSSPKKNILGLYLRKRLGVDTTTLITTADLERYGRTTIDISLQSEGVYYLDFSVK